ncbi:glucose/arabinose dehydrogenase [Paenarthrobacter ilicis]|uniref:Glucose/arabinose dehydrogenase n=2 Tax=Paenarthrobacter ilicis TaxID=43665 RepID=A0ABX0TF12_9MICC|nr:glucose/arabinose dehydrogenase [Paenarthrobacter ilicis]NII99780.1 glucose/arabinose dehydrogenase [Paenarthrobacter ilicis]
MPRLLGSDHHGAAATDGAIRGTGLLMKESDHRGPRKRPGCWLRSLVLGQSAAWALVLTACTGGSGGIGNPAGTTNPGQSPSAGVAVAATVEVIGRLDVGLTIPWSLVFRPDGSALVSERNSGEVKLIRDGRSTSLGRVAGVEPNGEGGLLGLALSPDVASDPWLYAYFTTRDDNRIARMKVVEEQGGELTLGSPEVVFSGIPKASTHNGGRIRFGPDGFLYVGTGDAQKREQPQDKNALGGKILRITPDGKPAPGNPFGTANPVFSYGHRNVQGLAWDEGGRLWASEFGPDVDDELNLITAGGNYGWPLVTGAPGKEGFTDAEVVWPATAEASPSGLEIIDGVAYTGALRGQRLWATPLGDRDAKDPAGTPVAYLTGQFGRLRDVARAPDGSLWVLTNNKNPDFVLILRAPSRGAG